MVEYLRKKIADSAAARWTVLGLVSFTMLTGYVMTDAMAPLKTMLEQQLGWDSTDYGVFTSGYGWFNIFLLMLIFGGMILDKKGPRFTGVLSVGLMIAGSLLKYWAVSTDFGGAVTSLSIGSWQVFSLKSQVLYATLGFAIFGVGIEMIGITANKVVVKWFRGKALASALGLNVAAGRIGTAIAMFGSLPFARAMGSPSAPLLVCLIMFCIGLSVVPGVLRDGPSLRPRNGNGASVRQRKDRRRGVPFFRYFPDRPHQGVLVYYDSLRTLLFSRVPFPEVRYRTDDPEVPVFRPSLPARSRRCCRSATYC